MKWIVWLPLPLPHQSLITPCLVSSHDWKKKHENSLCHQLGPIQNHSNHATHVACDNDETAQPPLVALVRGTLSPSTPNLMYSCQVDGQYCSKSFVLWGWHLPPVEPFVWLRTEPYCYIIAKCHVPFWILSAWKINSTGEGGSHHMTLICLVMTTFLVE